tara:strand:- start:595 stop:768 length:174 start_codon:yes stop_codon:yes gene_type:complete
MSFKNIGLSIMFVFLSAYNFIYTPLSYVSYWLGVLFAVASIGVFIKDSKSEKKNDKK